MRLPEELVSLIFEHLNADEPPFQRDTVEWDTPVVWDNPLAPTGAACCLVSKQFLPYGRKLLYSHIDSRECREWMAASTRPSFPESVALLVDNPHLASIVRAGTYEVHPRTVLSEIEAFGPLSSCTPNLSAITLNCRLLEFERGAEARVERRQYFSRCETFCDVALAALVPSQLRRLALSGWGTAGWNTVLDFLGRCTDLQELDLAGVFPDEQDAAGAPLCLPTLRKLKLRFSEDTVLPSLLAAAANLESLSLLDRGFNIPRLETPLLALKAFTAIISTNDSAITEDIRCLADFLPSAPTVTRIIVKIMSQGDSDSAPSDDTSAAFLRALPSTLTHLSLFGSSAAFLPTALAFQPANYPALISYSPFWPRMPDDFETWSPLVKACADAGVRLGGSLRLFKLQDRILTTSERMDRILAAFEERVQEVDEQMLDCDSATADALQVEVELLSRTTQEDLVALSRALLEIDEEWKCATAEVKAQYLEM